MATEHSDVDVFVVLTDEAAEGRTTSRSRYIDEIPQTLADLEDVPLWGGDEYGYRWGYATRRCSATTPVAGSPRPCAGMETHTVGGGPADAAATATSSTATSTWPTARSSPTATAARLERRLDAAESVHWWLDVVFTLEGRVRPYNKYLAWELREHPLSVPEWSAERLLPQVEAVLDGDADAVRAAYAVVERECLAWDERHGGHDLHELIEGWGDELALLRGG